MRKYITAYIAYVDMILSENNAEKIRKLKAEHLKQIEFMQHERMIHLIITVLFALILFITIGILSYTDNMAYFFLIILILALLIPYIFHYYLLENGVQKMYRQYNEMNDADKLPDECRLPR